MSEHPYPWWFDNRTGAEAVTMGDGCLIAPDARLDGGAGPIRLGANCHIHPGALLLPYGGRITLGDNCTVNPYAVLYGHGGLDIGDNVRIATQSVIVASNHVFTDPDIPIFKQGLTMQGIVIEDDVWIGARVTILDGAHIGRGSVIAAGSVVRGRHEPLSILAGTPARLIRKRGQ